MNIEEINRLSRRARALQNNISQLEGLDCKQVNFLVPSCGSRYVSIETNVFNFQLKSHYLDLAKAEIEKIEAEIKELCK